MLASFKVFDTIFFTFAFGTLGQNKKVNELIQNVGIA
jgi:hypothetical protein|tara:strand:- start:113 stop:223 length:111 start_codon:yes stop_codon:yes gene_type:complete